MALERFRLSDTLPAPPDVVYAAWLSADLHAKMTGGAKATSDPRVGGEFTAWDGYITGRYLLLEPNARIVQTWRTTGFKDDDNDSRLEILLEPDAEGTRIVFVHSDLPEGTGGEYEQGWVDHYLEPMRAHFGG